MNVACPACGEQVQVPVVDDEPARAVDAVTEPVGIEPEEDDSSPEAVEAQTTQLSHESAEPQGHLRSHEAEDEEEGFHLSRRVELDDELDMTPMVDVTFLLLIFFMITASFSLQKSMESEPPEPEKEGYAQMPTIDDLADESVIVEIDENDTIFVDDEAVGGPGELEDVLRHKVASEQKLEMIIEPHYQAKHGTVVAVTDAGVTVGMQRIRRVSTPNE